MKLYLTIRATLVAAMFVGAGCTAAEVDPFITVRAPVIALTHATVIDGTGGPALRDQTVVVDRGQIAAVGSAPTVALPPGAHVIELRGHTVIPGLVGMHDHLFYAADGGQRYISAPRRFAQLYLAAGVTTIRTGGTIDLAADARTKRDVDAGRWPGPSIHLTSAYIHSVSDRDHASAVIDDLVDSGATSVKVYTSATRQDLGAVVQAAHQRGLKVTGHLCAVGFREAAALGIDNLEHGLIVDTEFYSRKLPDVCPDWGMAVSELLRVDVDGGSVQETIRQLVRANVAVTSTLALFETFSPRSAYADPRVEVLLAPDLLDGYRRAVSQHIATVAERRAWEGALKVEMAFERSFVRAGGLLMAGADPTGWGHALPGAANHRNIELLVEAGFSIEQAIRIASANGATFLGQLSRIGTVTAGKRADLVVLRGDLTTDVRALRDVRVVFRDGLGYAPQLLLAAVRGQVGAERPTWMSELAAGAGIFVLGMAAAILASRVARRKKTPAPPPG